MLYDVKGEYMTKKTFRHDFLRGLGSALIELQQCGDPARFYDVVLYGCLHNTTYDIQCEGVRGRYLHQAAKLTKKAAVIEKAVRRKLFYPRPVKKGAVIELRIGVSDVGLFEQLVSILYYFAAENSEIAGNALWQLYDIMLSGLRRKRKLEKICDRRDMFDLLCVWLTSLNGWRAFKVIVCEVSEALLRKDADFFFSEWFFDNSKSKFGSKRVDEYLRKQSEKSPFVRVYYEKTRKWEHFVSEKLPIPTLDEVLAAAAKGRFRGRGTAMHYARNASPEDLEKLAQAAMNATDANVQLELLWPFREVAKYTLPESFLLKLRQSGDEQLRKAAYEIIGQNPSAKTRELALSLLNSGEDIANGISLLVKNLVPEDEPLLYDLIRTVPVSINETYRGRDCDYDWHSIYGDVEDGIKSLRGKPKTNILEYLYRNTFCGSCRECIVRLMRKKGVLSDIILNECLFDANSDIREFAERINKFRVCRK